MDASDAHDAIAHAFCFARGGHYELPRGIKSLVCTELTAPSRVLEVDPSPAAPLPRPPSPADTSEAHYIPAHAFCFAGWEYKP